MTSTPQPAMRLSNAKVNTWRRCPKRYEFKYVHKLRPKRKAIQLERGSWIHDLLMVHYDGHDWREKQAELEREFYKLFEEEREHLGELPAECQRIMQSYLLHYRQEDAQYHTIDSELDEIMTLPNGLEFNFIIDRIYEDREGGLWLQDHKTSAKGFLDPDFMLLDAQLTRYFWCAEKMGYRPLRGIEFNEIRTKPPVVPKLTESGKRLEMRMNMDTDVYTYLRAIKRHGFDPRDYRKILGHLNRQDEKFFRRSRLPQHEIMQRTMMKELVDSAREIRAAERRGAFPRTARKECNWDCDYKNLCIHQLQGGNIDPLIKLHFRVGRREED